MIKAADTDAGSQAASAKSASRKRRCDATNEATAARTSLSTASSVTSDVLPRYPTHLFQRRTDLDT